MNVLFPLPAIALGFVVALECGAPWKSFLPNIVAVALGAGLLRLAQRVRPPKRGVIVAVALALVFATLFGEGSLGVRRWLTAGPFALHVSAALSPFLYLALQSGPRRWAVSVLVLAQMIHIAQPDAASALAFGMGALPLCLPLRWGSLLMAVSATTAVIAFFRADPLQPLDHVEGVLRVLLHKGVLSLVATGFATILLFLPFARALKEGAAAQKPLAAALILHLAGLLLATELGHFPVPVFGAGAGHVFGWYSMNAVLAMGGDPEPQR